MRWVTTYCLSNLKQPRIGARRILGSYLMIMNEILDIINIEVRRIMGYSQIMRMMINLRKSKCKYLVTP